jgi:hypothetical protein
MIEDKIVSNAPQSKRRPVPRLSALNKMTSPDSFQASNIRYVDMNRKYEKTYLEAPDSSEKGYRSAKPCRAL